MVKKKILDKINELREVDLSYNYTPTEEAGYLSAIEDVENVIKLLHIQNVSGSALLDKAKQMRLEQQHLVDTYAERYNSTELGILQGIDRIVRLIERHYR